jgi:hypothetical protein
MRPHLIVSAPVFERLMQSAAGAALMVPLPSSAIAPLELNLLYLDRPSDIRVDSRQGCDGG